MDVYFDKRIWVNTRFFHCSIYELNILRRITFSMATAVDLFIYFIETNIERRPTTDRQRARESEQPYNLCTISF